MEYSFDELQRVAERMWKDNFFFMYRWSPETLAVWLRHNCKCVYCDRDLLENRDIAYFFSDREHVLPKSKYPSLEFDPNNIVVACAACNTIKGRLEPQWTNAAGRVRCAAPHRQSARGTGNSISPLRGNEESRNGTRVQAGERANSSLLKESLSRNRGRITSAVIAVEVAIIRALTSREPPEQVSKSRHR
jgi:hypothetical protein